MIGARNERGAASTPRLAKIGIKPGLSGISITAPFRTEEKLRHARSDHDEHGGAKANHRSSARLCADPKAAGSARCEIEREARRRRGETQQDRKASDAAARI